MKVALAQMNVVPGDVEANLARHLAWIQRAIRAKADLILFPELSLTGEPIDSPAVEPGLSLQSPALLQIREASRRIDVLVGLIELAGKNSSRRYNAAIYFSAGALLHRHRKVFLVNYAVFEEGKHYLPGEQLRAFDTGLGRMCTMICNDTWHTVAPYLAALEGAQALLVPASSARGTLQHHLDIPSTWMCMNRTYSATMGFYTVFVNRVGLFRGRFPFWGGSEIIGPRGEVVVQAPLDREALVIGEIDLNRVRAQRRAAPILRDAPLGVLQQAFTRSTAVRSEPLEVHREALPLGRNLPPSEPPARKGADA